MDLKPEIIDGIKVYDIPKGDLKEASKIFQVKLQAIYIKAKDAAEAAGKTLSKDDISALRNSPELGMWLSDGKPLSVTNVNAFLTGKEVGSAKKKIKNLSLVIPKDKANTFGRAYFENIKNASPEFRNWLDRLDGVSKKGTFWPKGTSFKDFKKYIAQDGYKKALEINKQLEAKYGIKFDVGHMWGAMGPKGDRTLIGPFGPRSEGKFTPTNVAPQPTSPSLKQLLSEKWNVITPNIPGFYDKAGYQIAGAQELLDVGAGGQGWSSALADYFLSKTPNISSIADLTPYEKAYIAFGDPTKGAGASLEARLAQVEDFRLNYNQPQGAQKNILAAIKDGTYQPPSKTDQLLRATAPPTNQSILSIIPKDAQNLVKNSIEGIVDTAKTVSELPIIKPALEVADVVRKHPVATAVTSLPVLTAFDVSEAVESGSNLLTNEWDQDAQIGKLEKQVEQSRFLAGSSGVASLTPAAPVMVPTCLLSSAVSVVLQNRLSRAKDKRHRENILMNPFDITTGGISELKENKRNIIERVKDNYTEWVRQ